MDPQRQDSETAGEWIRDKWRSAILCPRNITQGYLICRFPHGWFFIEKGARVSNRVIFLGSRGALKIPQLIAEVMFPGLFFTVLRFILTLLAMSLMEKIIRYLLLNKRDKAAKENSPKE